MLSEEHDHWRGVYVDCLIRLGMEPHR
jgi:hypothetical protein